MTKTLEELARAAWVSWGHAYAQFQCCDVCGKWSYCRGRNSAKLICLECFDQT